MCFHLPDPGGPLRPTVLWLPTAGLSRAAGLSPGRPSRRLEPHQEEALHSAQGR